MKRLHEEAFGDESGEEGNESEELEIERRF